jgi:hypothetical protein
MWATALELYLHKSDDSYRTRRDADTGGRVVRGLAWARNAVIHDLLNVHVIQGGFTFPLAFPAIETWGAWWLRRDQVVVTFLDSRPGNEKANDEHVAGRPVLTTLREAQDFLFMRAIPNMVTGPERAALARGSEDQRRHRPGCVALHPGVTWR